MRENAIFILLLILHSISIYIFCSGFLLTRFELNEHSSCSSPSSFSLEESKQGCWFPSSDQKVLIVLIDALRFDFVEWKEKNEPKDFKNNENKLAVIDRLLKKEEKSSLLFQFVADPPTVTMQRLKGLTTGGMPTFIDISKNFGASEIKEDNWLIQCFQRGFNVGFLGDDTWLSLYPSIFLSNLSFPFPSFDVYDLHSVDQGIQSNLFNQMKRKDWKILIAHFLGVDHVGHRYDSNAPAMAEKLTEMNAMIEKVIEEMDSETMLIVMGDHGSTEGGNHGGSSPEEINSALFFYRKTPFLLDGQVTKEVTSVNQVDFVPTLSLLLGLPIPFGNVGTVIPSLFLKSQSLLFHLNEQNSSSFIPNPLQFQNLVETNFALHLNSLQVFQYLKSYSAQSNSFQSSHFQHLFNSFLQNEERFQSQFLHMKEYPFHYQNQKGQQEFYQLQKTIYLEYRFIHSQILEMCRELWVSFNVESMFLGSILLCFSLLLTLFLFFSSHQLSSIDYFALFFLFLHSIGLFSNSFIEAENQVVPFLSNSLLFLVLFCGWKANCGEYRRKMGYLNLFCGILFGITSKWMNFTTGGIYEREGDTFFKYFSSILLPTLLVSLLTFKYWKGRKIVFWINISLISLWWFFQWANFHWIELKLIVPWSIYLSFFFHSKDLFNGHTSAPDRISNLMKGGIPLWIMLLGLNGPFLLLLFSLHLAIVFHLSNIKSRFSFHQSILVSFAVIQFFFAQGHRYELNTFHFRAAFLGFESMNFYGGGILVLLETFFPLLFTILFVCCFIGISNWSPEQITKNATQLFIGIIFFFSSRATMTCLFVFGARRHLMMWRVFAPKFIFDQLFLLVIDLLIIFAIFLLRSNKT